MTSSKSGGHLARARGFGWLCSYFAVAAFVLLGPFVAGSATAPRVATTQLKAPADLAHRLILIGDTGSPDPSEEVLDSLRRWGDVAPELTTVLFLGDNAYPAGLSEKDPTRAKAILQRWIGNTAAAKIFIPGNHDWGSPRRVSAVVSEQAFLDPIEDVEFFPKDGCPGPVAHTLVPAGKFTKAVSVIFLDMQWWHLASSERPTCGAIETPEQMLEALTAELESRRDEWVVVANHRPLRAHADAQQQQHRDDSSWLDSLLHLSDTWDVEALDRIESAMASAPPLIAVGGHEHSLQVIKGHGSASYLLISGAGGDDKLTPVRAGDGTLFAAEHSGFLVLDFRHTQSGDRVTLAVVEAGFDTPSFAMDLAQTQPSHARAR